MMTKKAKLEQFETVQAERDLLQRYFWDSRAGVKPEQVVREKTEGGDRCKLSVYKREAAHGGYVVIEWNPGTASIEWYDSWRIRVASEAYIGSYNLLMKRAVAQFSMSDIAPVHFLG